jgi:diguanylate cyclase (GGDEF)-like protein/PAS domain S-box-containing protein
MLDPATSLVPILERMTDGFVALDRDWRFVYVNGRAGELYGRDPAELVGRRIWTEFPEGLGGAFHLACERAMRDQEVTHVEHEFEAWGRTFENAIYPSAEGLTVFFQDITDRKVADREIRRREERYRVLVDAVSSVVWTADVHGDLRDEPAGWEELTGQSWEESQGRGWMDVVLDEDRPRVEAVWDEAFRHDRPFELEFRVHDAEGRVRNLSKRGVPVVDEENGRVQEWIGVDLDITQQRASEAALRRAALEDPLTGLANRALFLDHLRSLTAHRDRGLAAVLYVDLDNFKAVNDKAGHAAGDELLVRTAERIRGAIRSGDTPARLSGDEFAVLCENLPHEAEAVVVGRRILDAIAQEDAGLPAITASVGVALIPPGEADAEEAIGQADAAMYRAKAAGGGCVATFDAELQERLRRREVVEGYLRCGLEHDQGLQLAYQPILDLTAESGDSAEALLRWALPDGTVLPPSDIVPVAEDTGLIVPMGLAVLAESCRRAREWSRSTGTQLRVSVNLSARQLASPDLERDVGRLLEDAGFEPGLLQLEVTESVLLEDLERAEVTLRALKRLGVGVAIDDFGTGYSSLAYLHRLPVDTIKIDRSFIAELPESSGSARIVEAVVGMARGLGLRVVAEGVERPEQLRAVREAGCDAAQGFLLSRPVDGADVQRAVASARVALAQVS